MTARNNRHFTPLRVDRERSESSRDRPREAGESQPSVYTSSLPGELAKACRLLRNEL